MKNKNVFVFTLILMLAMSFTASAHPGKTDEYGGHYDGETGEYHYHHGYFAHDHENGECPFDFNDNEKYSGGDSYYQNDDEYTTVEHQSTTEHSDYPSNDYDDYEIEDYDYYDGEEDEYNYDETTESTEVAGEVTTDTNDIGDNVNGFIVLLLYAYPIFLLIYWKFYFDIEFEKYMMCSSLYLVLAFAFCYINDGFLLFNCSFWLFLYVPLILTVLIISPFIALANDECPFPLLKRIISARKKKKQEQLEKEQQTKLQRQQEEKQQEELQKEQLILRSNTTHLQYLKFLLENTYHIGINSRQQELSEYNEQLTRIIEKVVIDQIDFNNSDLHSISNIPEQLFFFNGNLYRKDLFDIVERFPIVYISKTGNRFHQKEGCCDAYIPIYIEEAKTLEFLPCKKCCNNSLIDWSNENYPLWYNKYKILYSVRLKYYSKEPEIIYTKLRGVTNNCIYDFSKKRQGILRNLYGTENIFLEPYTNEKGESVFLVVSYLKTDSKYDLGELTKQKSKILYNNKDKKISVKITAITGRDSGYNLGCNVEITME